MLISINFSRLLVISVVLLILLSAGILIIPAEMTPHAVLWLSSHFIHIVSSAAIVFVLLLSSKKPWRIRA